MSFSVRDRNDPSYASYWIKTFGATLADLQFFRLPRVIQQAREAIPDEEVAGFLACALERPPQMTGLMFCDRRKRFPEGLPAHTPPIVKRYYRDGYLIVQVEGGGLYVVAHWYHQNGALGPFHKVH
ncbi:hypothetical protein QN400_24015 [Pseudomonas sp. RTC3]|uniref:hypothetical protein n=1 Tax=Pseudomonas sp. 5C2 TaxID=3048588 RepID=UPI002AB59A01|nr:hypothetical protein [Pseudomonas sp. 5C2]MDY7564719.1 hypothetical protein [Pseudomonas sp. 5C2]MEB0065075.1 hypothetical protein [Pseudomonas sp. RTC3]MEB0243717.1 hypothetical protein [Pseudomonas sp. 5C2]